MDNTAHTSATMALVSCSIVWVNKWLQLLSDNGQLVVTMCAIVTTIATVALGVLNYRLKLKHLSSGD